MANEYTCPECGNQLKAWFDIDASVEFNISTNGKISKPQIQSECTGDLRFGVKCSSSSCSWECDAHSDDIDSYSTPLEVAGEKAELIELTIKRSHSK